MPRCLRLRLGGRVGGMPALAVPVQLCWGTVGAAAVSALARAPRPLLRPAGPGAVPEFGQPVTSSTSSAAQDNITLRRRRSETKDEIAERYCGHA